MTDLSEQSPPPTENDGKKASRPWYKKKRIIIPLALVVVIIIAIAASGGSDPSTTTETDQASGDTSASSEASASSDAGASTEASASSEDPPAQETSPYDEKYGSFTPISKKGSGDSSIPLPKDATAATVTLTHKGSSNFSVSVLDADNQPTGDLLVNTIGSYSGTSAYGLSELGGEATKLKVSADGKWTLKIKPISASKQLPATASGTGDAVYVYDGDAADGRSNTGARATFQWPSMATTSQT